VIQIHPADRIRPRRIVKFTMLDPGHVVLRPYLPFRQ
jgi:hypothetical protein